MTVEMGSTGTKEKQDNSEDNSISKDSNTPPTLLPLNKKVRVHLVPKFYTSEERGITRSFYLLVTLQGVKDLYQASVGVTATVEFHERRQSLGGSSSSFIRREALTRTRSDTVNSIDGPDIEVKQVTVKENDSLRIAGVFTKDLGSIPDLTNCDSFDLILCPSYRISTEHSDWLLLGTMYTKHANSKHARHWRAAVRADYS
ncbi:uncharacterized protein LOC144653050 [Oculina patagonica]